MQPIIIFAIVTAVVLAAVIVIDWKGQPFQMDKEQLSLKVVGVILAVMFVFILLNGTKVGEPSAGCNHPRHHCQGYSTVTLLAKLRGWSTFKPFCTAIW